MDCGTDFPTSLRSVIDSWSTNALLRPRSALTTKGWNGYGANEHRAFKYLTPKLRLTSSDLTPTLLASRSFHLICSPLRCVELVNGILARRPPGLQKPLFIWEPVPDLCTPEELANTFDALPFVDVISPNHAELAALFGYLADSEDGNVDRFNVEACSTKLLEAAARKRTSLAVVVRAGREGCYVASYSPSVPNIYTKKSNVATKWLPAYHGSSPDKVVDPTGGGNGFLGGFAVGLVRAKDVVEAAIWGAVSASFAIEQVGVPTLMPGEGAGHERWNGVVVEERIDEFKKRCLSTS